MIERGQADAIIRAMYDARVRGDVDAILAHCSPDVSFCISGSSAAGGVAQRVSGAKEVGETIRRLVGAFEFRDIEIVDFLVDGAKAAVHWRVNVRSLASGEAAETELFDLIRFEGDKVVSYHQFADTALVGRLLQS